MSEANNEVKTGEQTSPAPGANGTPAAGTSPAGTPPKAETAPKTEPKTEPAGSAAGGTGGTGGTSAKKIGADDDDIPDGDELIQMSPKALKARLTRATSSALKEAFGTSDIETIKKMVEKAKKADEKAEEERRASLSEQERLKEDRDREKARADAAEARFTAAERQRIVEKQDARITRLAEKHLDPDYIESEFPRLARDLGKAFKAKDPKLLKNEEAWIDKWFEKRVAEKPKLGKNYQGPAATQETEPKEEPPKKVLMNNGVATHKPDPAKSGTTTNKTAKPGQPNSLSDREIRDLGYQYK